MRYEPPIDRAALLAAVRAAYGLAPAGLRFVPVGYAAAAYELRDEYPRDPNNPNGPRASHWSFLFGPSITFGNVGTNL